MITVNLNQLDSSMSFNFCFIFSNYSWLRRRHSPAWKIFPLRFTRVYLPVCVHLPLSWSCVTVCNIKHMSSCSCGWWRGGAGNRRSQTVWLTPAPLLILSPGRSWACRERGGLMNKQAVCSVATGGRWWRQRGLDKHQRRLAAVKDSG